MSSSAVRQPNFNFTSVPRSSYSDWDTEQSFTGARPLSKPSARPLAQPSARPSAKPLAKPLAQPSAQPSAKPLAQPSAKPLAQPSAKPLAPVKKMCTLEKPAVYEKKKFSALRDKWSLYYHLPDDSHWDLQSYTLLMHSIDDPEKLISINEVLPDVVVKNAMLFVMRGNIKPMWEDERNRKGGYLSFKVMNKNVHQVWKTMFYGVCGETLFTKPENNAFINGLSISPKKTFCIIKVWLSDGQYQTSEMIPIPNLYSSTDELKYTAFEAQIEADKAR